MTSRVSATGAESLSSGTQPVTESRPHSHSIGGVAGCSLLEGVGRDIGLAAGEDIPLKPNALNRPNSSRKDCDPAIEGQSVAPAGEVEPVAVSQHHAKVPTLAAMTTFKTGIRQRNVEKVRPSASTRVKDRPSGSRGCSPEVGSTISTPLPSGLMLTRRSSSDVAVSKAVALLRPWTRIGPEQERGGRATRDRVGRWMCNAYCLTIDLVSIMEDFADLRIKIRFSEGRPKYRGAAGRQDHRRRANRQDGRRGARRRRSRQSALELARAE